ncbi:DUF5606 domain-containing protein [Flammeovirgaceae bacterium SG7u.111]|nr:DUF5606 domain-containing protein [Flammeovirgaceae bacterium SG7u.132]WPO35561.1 DUF5606 domain-containing protein [Flammeovirgaceae bacterium SG7u.111]
MSGFTLKEITTIAGKSGLFKVIKTTRTGMIVESLDDKKTKVVVTPSHRVSVLKEISVYTTGAEESVELEDVFKKITALRGESVEIDLKDNAALMSFIEEILPDYDRSKVYPSDIKKIVSWYNLLKKELPEVFAVEEAEAPKEETPKAEAKPKKKKAEEKPAEDKEESKS